MKDGKSSCLMFSRGSGSLSYVTNEVSRKGFLSRLDQCYLGKLNIGSDNTRIILTLSFELDEGFEAKKVEGSGQFE